MKRLQLKNARVISLTTGRPDAENIDLLIEDDRIVEMGTQLNYSDAESIDFTGRIIIPGLVNAHLHTWQGSLRCVGADWTLEDYLAHVHGDIARHCTPDDMTIASLVSALNQINCGTTTIGDWCHNNPTPAHTDAGIEGLLKSGIRAVFLHGTPYTAPDSQYPIHEIDRLLKSSLSAQPLLNVGMAVRGPQYSTPKVAINDFRSANERGIVISMHQSGGTPAEAWQAVYAAGLIGPKTNIVHGAGLTNDWIKRLVDNGASFTCTPENELGQGHCIPVVGPLLRLGAAPSIGTDVDSLVSPEMLTAARMALAVQRGLDHDQHRQANGGMFSPKPTVSSKQALEWVTVKGAKALGLADRIGHINVGMQADLVVIDARMLNLWPAHDPLATALHASMANIEAVMIAGSWQKFDHALAYSDLEDSKNKVLASGERLVQSLNSSGLMAKLRRGVVRQVVHHKLKSQMKD